MRNFLDGVFCILRVAHESEMFPNDFFVGTNVETSEIGVKRSPAFETCGVLVAVGNVCSGKSVCDDDFGF